MVRFRIFGFRSEGTYAPSYSSCEVYNDGEVVLEEGYLLDSNNKNKLSKKIPIKALDEIRKVINNNRRILSIDKLEIDGPAIEDGTYETLVFCDGFNESILSVDSLRYRINQKEYYEKSEYTDLLLLINVYEKIRKILMANGIDERYC